MTGLLTGAPPIDVQTGGGYLPLLRASANACSSINLPRATLTRITPSFMDAMTSVLMMPFVSGVTTAWSVMMSLVANRSAKGSSLTFNSAPVSVGTRVERHDLHAEGLGATGHQTAGIYPKPIIPSVFSNSSVPTNCDCAHSPAASEL